MNQWGKPEKIRRCKLCVASSQSTPAASNNAPPTTTTTPSAAAASVATTTATTAPIATPATTPVVATAATASVATTSLASVTTAAAAAAATGPAFTSPSKKLAPSSREKQRVGFKEEEVVIHTRPSEIRETPTSLTSYGVELPLAPSPTKEAKRGETAAAVEAELRAKVTQLETDLAKSLEERKTQQAEIARLQAISEEHKFCADENKRLEGLLAEQARASLKELSKLQAAAANDMKALNDLPERKSDGLRADANTLNHVYNVVTIELERLVREDTIARLMPDEEKGPWVTLEPAYKLRHYIHRLEQLLEEKRLDQIILSAQCNTLAQTASAQPINDMSFARLQATKVQRMKNALHCWMDSTKDIAGDPPSIPGMPEIPIPATLKFDLERNLAFAADEGPGDDDTKWDHDTKIVNALFCRDVPLVKRLLEGVAELSLADAGLNDVDVETLASALFGNNTITHLHLDENFFGNMGCDAIASSLVGNHSLRVLTLVKNQIKDGGALALLRTLQGCHEFGTGCAMCGRQREEHPFCQICQRTHTKDCVTFQYQNLGGVAIRKGPAYPGVRTTTDIAYREVLCATQVVTIPHLVNGKEYNIRFFELADGRGWVHDFHPEWQNVPTIQILPDRSCQAFQYGSICSKCHQTASAHPWDGVPVERLVIAENEVSHELQQKLHAVTKNNRTRANLNAESNIDTIAVEVTVAPSQGMVRGILKKG